MGVTYGIMGAGMQGPAVAYDLAQFANPDKILLADINEELARSKAHKVNRLVGREIVEPRALDVTNDDQIAQFYAECGMIVSAVPWQLNQRLAEKALEHKVSFIDMGNEPDWFWFEFRKRNQEAVDAGITIVPDTGLAPGMVNHLGLYCMENMDECDEIRLRCGGLPQTPRPPLGYKLVFNIIGVISEYTGEAHTIQDGKIVMVPTLNDVEAMEIAPLGVLEAASTSGGTSTAPYTLMGKVKNYNYKTLRYPGHWQAIQSLRDLGFFDEHPIGKDGCAITPRDVAAAVIPDKIRFPEDKDLIVVHAFGRGKKDERPYEISLSIIDYHDDDTGFSAMERMTGFASSIIAQGIANGITPKGLVPYEQTMTGHQYVKEFLRRGFRVTEKIEHVMANH
ncbi:MAG: saccharopine dehydrogenase NADP-binding domain-containing protein [Armatimonadetes bacterium]|nr:saccharopine dehydrogenase NADP-binding domain-containing protein [Armatimonadota bacterium]